MIRYAIIIEKAADNSFCTYVPDLPGCVGIGEMCGETIENISEGKKFNLVGMKEKGYQIQELTSEAENLVFEFA